MCKVSFFLLGSTPYLALGSKNVTLVVSVAAKDIAAKDLASYEEERYQFAVEMAEVFLEALAALIWKNASHGQEIWRAVFFKNWDNLWMWRWFSKMEGWKCDGKHAKVNAWSSCVVMVNLLLLFSCRVFPPLRINSLTSPVWWDRKWSIGWQPNKPPYVVNPSHQCINISRVIGTLLATSRLEAFFVVIFDLCFCPNNKNQEVCFLTLTCFYIKTHQTIHDIFAWKTMESAKAVFFRRLS